MHSKFVPIFNILLCAYSATALASAEIPQCPSLCSVDQVCMNNFASFGMVGTATCVPIPSEAPIPNLSLPVDANTELVCVHSSGSGSHSGSNAFYALDLSTDYSQSAAIVRAAAEGTAYVFGSDPRGVACSPDPNTPCALCPAPSGSPANALSSSCGNAWGNHSMIFHGNGYASLYVHLDHPLVKTGALVHKGDPIGVEGWTGAAGSRQIHWSVQQIPGSTLAEWTTHISQGWVGDSVPFHFSAKQNGSIQNFEVSTIQCAHADIGQAPANQQPRFNGVQ